MSDFNLLNTPQRDKQIDTMKFLLIFSIFIFHFEGAAGNFYPFVNIYQVAIFFMISGFWALNQTKKSVVQFLCDAFKKYLIYWFVFVIIYTAYHTIANSLSVSESLDTFVRYFCAVRGTNIYGMWFTPAFFFVSFIYFLFAKAFSKIFKLEKHTLALVCCVIFFLVYYVTKYFLVIPPKSIFSFAYVSEYLFYFSLGTITYIIISALKPKLKTSLFLKLLNAVITILSALWFLVYFFKKENLICGWTESCFGGKLSFLPDLVTVILMFFFISAVARCISCDFTAKIGQKTLGLCHCEAFTKGVMVFLGSLFGLTVTPKNPIESLIFAFLALVVGAYIVLPVTDMITRRISSINKK